MKQTESMNDSDYHWVVPVFISAFLLQPVYYWIGEWNFVSILLATSPVWIWLIHRFLAKKSEAAIDSMVESCGEVIDSFEGRN